MPCDDTRLRTLAVCRSQDDKATETTGREPHSGHRMAAPDKHPSNIVRRYSGVSAAYTRLAVAKPLARASGIPRRRLNGGEHGVKLPAVGDEGTRPTNP